MSEKSYSNGFATIRQFIVELEEVAKQFGDDAEITVWHGDGDEMSPGISAGILKGDKRPKVRIL